MLAVERRNLILEKLTDELLKKNSLTKDEIVAVLN